MLRKEMFKDVVSTTREEELSLEWFGLGRKQNQDAKQRAERSLKETKIDKKDLRKYSKKYLTAFKDILKQLEINVKLEDVIKDRLVGPHDSSTTLLIMNGSELNENNVFDILLYAAGRHIGHMASRSFRIDVSHLTSRKESGEILAENDMFVATFMTDGDESFLYLYTKHQVITYIELDSDARDQLFDFVTENISKDDIQSSSVTMLPEGIGEFKFYIKDTARLVRDDQLEGLELLMSSSRELVTHIFHERVYQGSIFKFKNEYVKLVVSPPKHRQPVLIMGI